MQDPVFWKGVAPQEKEQSQEEGELLSLSLRLIASELNQGKKVSARTVCQETNPFQQNVN